MRSFPWNCSIGPADRNDRRRERLDQLKLGGARTGGLVAATRVGDRTTVSGHAACAGVRSGMSAAAVAIRAAAWLSLSMRGECERMALPLAGSPRQKARVCAGLEPCSRDGTQTALAHAGGHVFAGAEAVRHGIGACADE